MNLVLLLITILLLVSFIFIAAIHFFWFLGGTWGFTSVIPKKINGSNLFTPKKIDCLVMSLVVFVFAILIVLKIEWVKLNVYSWILQYGCWILAVVFLLRAIGDFKYIGFFKKIKNSDFALQDSKFFSPFCLSIAILLVFFSILT